MTNRQQGAAALVALGIAGTIAVVPAVTRDKPAVKGLISKSVTVAAPTPKCLETPGKEWGGQLHYSPAILRPTVLERACITYPLRGGTVVRVTTVAP